VEAIEAQGWMGQVTTQNTGAVAAQTIDAALRGEAVVVPGMVNRVIRALSAITPPALAARMIGRRWMNAQQARVKLPLSAPAAESL
jgi:short-subunit dehydrogenase